jgi:hypothetical protein
MRLPLDVRKEEFENQRPTLNFLYYGTRLNAAETPGPSPNLGEGSLHHKRFIFPTWRIFDYQHEWNDASTSSARGHEHLLQFEGMRRGVSILFVLCT